MPSALTGLTAIDIAINNGSIQLLRRLEQHCPYAAYLAVKVGCCITRVNRPPHQPDCNALQASILATHMYSCSLSCTMQLACMHWRAGSHVPSSVQCILCTACRCLATWASAPSGSRGGV